MKPKNFPERKRLKLVGVRSRLVTHMKNHHNDPKDKKTLDHQVELSRLDGKIAATSMRDVRTKKVREGKVKR